MLLYLLRHADAVTAAASDAARELTEKGEAQAAKVGRFCEAANIRPTVILTSPLRRAEQTARLAAGEMSEPPEVVVTPFLASGMDPETALDELKSYTKFESVMLVGHEPDFSQLAAHLLGANGNGSLKLRKASLTAVEIGSLKHGSGTLQFSIPVKLM